MKSFFTPSISSEFSVFWHKVFFPCTIVLVFFTQSGLSQTWTEDWEGNWIVDWHVDAGTWQVGTPTSGPGIAYNGQNCAATVLAGNYSEPVNSRLIRHTSFVVPAASENPRIRFWYWFSFAADDWGEVQIKTSTGAWESISNRIDNYGSNAWSYGSVDISAYADSTVQIAFYFYSDLHNYYGDVSSGWYIDEINIVGYIPTNISVNQSIYPDKFLLQQNYPNPFNPSTNIKYSIPEMGFVTLKVFDVLGNEVATLVNEEKPAGSYVIEFNGSEITSGIYFYKLQAGNFVEIKKMIFLK